MPDRLLFYCCLLIAGFCLLCSLTASSQQSVAIKKDTTLPDINAIKNTGKSITDSINKKAGNVLSSKKQQALNIIKDTSLAKRMKFAAVGDSIAFDFKHPFKNMIIRRPVVKFRGGFVSYNYNYRSNIDTPYTEKDISQHQLTARLNLTVAGFVPLQVNFWGRRSNSSFFKDITDVQVAFDGLAFRQQLQAALQARLMALSSQVKDSTLEKLYELKKLKTSELDTWLKDPLNLQKLVEANEILKVPRITFDPRLPDSLNFKREDSIKKFAAYFIDVYYKTKGQYDSLQKQTDSLKLLYEKNLIKVNEYKAMVSDRQYLQTAGMQKLRNTIGNYGLDSVNIPAKYKWLLGIRSFSLGRSPVSYSELTAKNISITGINFEYNSWYYFAVTAGLVDYRFRDFAIGKLNRKPQYLYMVRAGVGRLEKNYLILSAFRGQKQLFTSGASAQLSTLTLTGFSLEAKWQVHPTTYMTGEIATSISPDFHTSPAIESHFSLNDKTNKAYAVKLYSFIPHTNTKMEGMYKSTGANYQSFSSFQTNAATESWYIKAEQGFFKKKLRLNAALRSNEFTNPYIVQQYKSNTVFKSLTATLRLRKWPVISVGYQPMSQLTKLDTQVIESRFQSLNISSYYQYKIKDLPAATTIVANKFYNNNSDTGFVYYNAINIYGSQSFFFNRFTASLSVSHTANNDYALNVLDGGIQININRLGTIGLGAKVNSLNKTLVKTGQYINSNIKIGKRDILYLSYENGYLPGFKGGLVKNAMGNIQFTKYFGAR